MRLPATLICLFVILWLFRRDIKESAGSSKALWIPIFWMFLAGSRYVSAWLHLGSQSSGLANLYNEGSPVDAAVFSLLILAGVVVLFKRRLDWGRLLTQNKLIFFYFLYCGMSILWSDYAFITFKRFVKELGIPVMALVILTEESPYEALGVVLRRLAFLLLPLSLLFVRYYPELGRTFHVDGSIMYTGVGNQKNDLGSMCLLAGIYFSWHYLLGGGKPGWKLGIKGNMTDFAFIGVSAWLLRMSQSATSLVCLLAAVGLFFVGRMRCMLRKPDRILVLLLTGISLFFVLDMTMDVRETLLRALGRDETLTSRVPAWQTLREMASNPFVGTGFMSFWSGERLKIIWERLGSTIIQAHNGYLEQYLNLGYMGVAFIGAIILSGLFKVRRHLHVDYPSAMLRFSFIMVAVLFNYTEASFYGVNNIWLLLMIGVIEIPGQAVLEGSTVPMAGKFAHYGRASGMR